MRDDLKAAGTTVSTLARNRSTEMHICKHLDKSELKWKIPWSDETKTEPVGNNSLKHGGGSITMWSCFSVNGTTGALHISKRKHEWSVLQKKLISSMETESGAKMDASTRQKTPNIQPK